MAGEQGESGRSWHKITIRGIVQGVGFRPFVYREARNFCIRGTVKNTAGLVEITASGPQLKSFVESVKKNKPGLSLIESVEIVPCEEPACATDGFSVVESAEAESGKAAGGPGEPRFFPPDLGLCDSCRGEIHSPDSRRYRHYFNSCTACGPRFSVLKAFPYDRANTSMEAFPMCAACSGEYHDSGERRFHAETICCNSCGPKLFYRRGNSTYKDEEAFSRALEDLPGGIAIKGMGGYHLACSPYLAEAVRGLRALKGREKKPFALMFRDTAAIAGVCEINREEESLLTSQARPIVLLKMKHNPFADEVFSGAQGRCGCFLPYTPLHELLLKEIPCLVMTSANFSSMPIMKSEAEIFPLMDKVLFHNREIVRGVEDSVLQVADRPLFIRRARGYTPLPVLMENLGNAPLLAMGGDLKAAFGFLSKNTFTLSQYMGDLESAPALLQYETGIADFGRLFAVQPRAIACDAHPGYFSSRLAKKLASTRKLPLIPVYHHHAHVASVMAEHGLKRVLGVAFDGSGYGEDAAIWGGEFLLCEEAACRRLGRLAYTEILGADTAALDAAKTAACYLFANGLKAKGIAAANPGSAVIHAALRSHTNTFVTSSMGRLFDAVAALLGICQTNSYEGECATLLQYAAEKEAFAAVRPPDMRFTCAMEGGQTVFGFADILQKCLEKPEGAALGFHRAVCDMIVQMCLKARETEKISDVALSGGVFQNILLLEMVRAGLAEHGFAVYTNEAVPPNDGGLALGQAYVAIRLINKEF